MKLLLDSHTLIWAVDNPAKLPLQVQRLILDAANDRFVSAATIWEIAIKVSLGKLPLSMPYREWMDRVIAELVLTFLPIQLDHTERMANLPWHHRDPFDRMLAAQALVEPIKLVSSDMIFDHYGVNRIWQ